MDSTIDRPSPRFSILLTSEPESALIESTLGRLRASLYDLSAVEVIIGFFGTPKEGPPGLNLQQDVSDPMHVTVMPEVHSSRAKARNATLALARGEWLTFVDGGDGLTPGALPQVATVVDGNPKTRMVTLRRQSVGSNGSTTGLSDPLVSHITRTETTTLRAQPNYFPYSVTGTFIRRADVADRALRFDLRIGSIVEEAHLLTRYLGVDEHTLISVIRTSAYVESINPRHFFRHRRDLVTAARYTTTWEWGIRDLVDNFTEGRPLPLFLQNLILHELQWLVRTETRTGLGSVARGDVAAAFQEHLLAVLPRLDPYVIDGYRGSPLSRAARDTLLHGFAGTDWHTSSLVVTKIDRRRQLVRLSYRFVGREPEFVWEHNGVVTAPVATKLQSLSYFEFGPVYERHVWVTSTGKSTFLLDGEGTHVNAVWQPARKYTLTGRELVGLKSPQAPRKRASRLRRYLPTPSNVQHYLPLILSRAPFIKKFLSDVWVLIDREDQGEDSAEVLFRYLRRHQSDTNAWFVVRRGTSTWKRLRADGHRRVAAYGSLWWKVLMLRAEFLISVQANPAVTTPTALARYRRRMRWRFIFLQHGVIKDDVSRWLNNKTFTMMLTSTHGEHQSIVGPDSRYVFSDLEIKLTGLPRFDALTEAEARTPETKKRSAILIAPTWRKWLDDLAADDLDAFASTEYAREWLGFITSPVLLEYARRHNLTVAVLPHPNLRKALLSLDLPDLVEMWDFEEGRAQQNFVEAAVLVTDYSSMAFNAAYLDRSVVYFQFDRERHDAGDHTALPGYFDYDRDGFGPRVEGHTAAVEATITAIDGDTASGVYSDRRTNAFAFRDGQASERVFNEIQKLRLPVSPASDEPEDPTDDAPTALENARTHAVPATIAGVAVVNGTGDTSPQGDADADAEDLGSASSSTSS